jgi:hypothetical protein
MPDFYKAGAAAGILVSEMLRGLAQGEPAAPWLGGHTTDDGKLGIVLLGSEDEAIAWHTRANGDPVVVLNNDHDNEVIVLLPHHVQRDQYAMVYQMQYARGGGRVFTSKPSKRIRVPDLDMIQSFERGFDQSVAAANQMNELTGWGELGDYEEAR